MILEEIENKVIRLTEERGVAASKYNNVAQEITKYCENQCAIKYENLITNKFIEFNIPEEITKKIDFIEKLNLKIKIQEFSKGNSYSGGGMSTLKYSNNIINNKIESAKIFINGYSYDGILFKHTVLTSLYHEINHCYDYYKDIMASIRNNNPSYRNKAVRYANSVLKGNMDTIPDLFNDKNQNKLFETIIYRLFSETELNALISSVYGTLQGNKSKRENFHDDIKLTQAYFLYTYIKNNYVKLFDSINEDNIFNIKNFFRKKNININPYGNSTESFKKELKRKTKFLLSRLIRGIGRAASVYYDNAETKVPTEIIKHKDPSIEIKY